MPTLLVHARTKLQETTNRAAQTGRCAEVQPAFQAAVQHVIHNLHLLLECQNTTAEVFVPVLDRSIPPVLQTSLVNDEVLLPVFQERRQSCDGPMDSTPFSQHDRHGVVILSDHDGMLSRHVYVSFAAGSAFFCAHRTFQVC